MSAELPCHHLDGRIRDWTGTEQPDHYACSTVHLDPGLRSDMVGSHDTDGQMRQRHRHVCPALLCCLTESSFNPATAMLYILGSWYRQD